MANPTAPLDSTSAKMGFGIYLDGANDAPAWVRILDAAVVADETTKSGAVSVAGMTAHDAVDPSAQGPIKVGGYAKAAAPTDVSADGDRVNAWFLRNGAQASVLTAAGALIGGDATRGLDVNVRPHSAGGLSTFNGTSSDGGTAVTNTAQAVKAAAGQLYGWFIMNPNDEVSFVNIYNTASGSVTVGTTAPLFQLEIPAGAAANLLGTQGIAFGTAIAVSATKTAGSATAPDVAMEVVLFYA